MAEPANRIGQGGGKTMDSLKQIEAGQKVTWEKNSSYFSRKKKKPKPPIKEDKNKNRVDVRA
jgi:hypothetical protein